uniref:Uncharacterized protein K0023E10.19 n=1 Tax=Oryza sativa subsp. indica TaxID=39946 RepID=C8TEU6_ORYSI|nr:hypothetical protein [Oryza sativa Indica Group]BAI39717.1 hypothetical protein [Oryza sativa Indica Group]
MSRSMSFIHDVFPLHHAKMRCHPSVVLSPLRQDRCRPSVILSLFVKINAAARPCIGASIVYINIKQEWCRL